MDQLQAHCWGWLCSLASTSSRVWALLRHLSRNPKRSSIRPKGGNCSRIRKLVQMGSRLFVLIAGVLGSNVVHRRSVTDLLSASVDQGLSARVRFRLRIWTLWSCRLDRVYEWSSKTRECSWKLDACPSVYRRWPSSGFDSLHFRWSHNLLHPRHLGESDQSTQRNWQGIGRESFRKILPCSTDRFDDRQWRRSEKFLWEFGVSGN